MERNEVIQGLLDMYSEPSYLEIGVCEGFTFHSLNAARKVAVDPAFRFNLEEAQADPANANAAYHQVPSDDYFASQAGANDMFDVIFVDGLHTFDQTLRDLLNAIARLKPGGAIIVDDVRPSSYHASLPSMDEFFLVRAGLGDDYPAWMGDVYRLVFFIRDYLASFSYATVQENHGQTVLWRATRALTQQPADVATVAAFEFKEVHLQSAAYNYQPFVDIKKRISEINK
ncbi:class I SAM-dependent methyltransferase [Novosphingobium sp. KACC 22771]|uniref:class I SAM-dependent methyltransferase n=1 Tax=Novosphingobium sp. KACC 22771 TaxID=3025670 RepID=UPI00236527EB|nr:class I SAM-dependent methyltransferase [Novosphingobium sp. KACC 22771]WDF72763.1 class I SAM-dependent methyltransferase [Novosphingobium sp. KACC 22771]